MANYRIFFGNRAAGAAPGAYTLPAAAGSYALTGVVTSLEFGRETLAVSGSYALSGQLVSLEYGREAAADPGSYALSGQPTSLEYGREVLALSGTYALTGTAATLTKTGAGATIFVGLTAGVTDGVIGSGGSLPTGWDYDIAGNVTLEVTGHGADDSVETFDLKISATTDAGPSFADIVFPAGWDGVAGASAGQQWRNASYQKVIATTGGGLASASAFSFSEVSEIDNTGTYLGSTKNMALPATSGAYQLSYREAVRIFSDATTTHASGDIQFIIDATGGNSSATIRLAANLDIVGAGVSAQPGSYGLSGTPAIPKLARKIPALVSSYALTGQATSLEWGREVLTTGGSYTLSGVATSLEYGREVLGTGGSYTLSGLPANLLRVGAKAIVALPGSYALSGQSTSLEYGRKILALGGSYALTGVDAVSARSFGVAGGSYALTGAAATLSKTTTVGTALVAVPGSYAVTGGPAALRYSGEIVVPPGSGQADGDIVRLKRRGRVYTIIIEEAKKVVVRSMPLRKKRKKLAKIIAEEVLPEAGGLLAADKLLLEIMIRRQLEQIPLNEMHTEGWYQLQDQLLEVITDAEQTAQRLRLESEEEDDLLLLLTS